MKKGFFAVVTMLVFCSCGRPTLPPEKVAEVSSRLRSSIVVLEYYEAEYSQKIVTVMCDPKRNNVLYVVSGKFQGEPVALAVVHDDKSCGIDK